MLVTALALALVAIKTWAFTSNYHNFPLISAKIYQTNEVNGRDNVESTDANTVINIPDLLELQKALDSETPEIKKLRICEQDQFVYELLSKACNDEQEVLMRMGLINKLPVESHSEAITRARYELRKPKEPNTIYELSHYIYKYLRSLFSGQKFAKPRDFSTIAKDYHDRIIRCGGNVQIPKKYNLNMSPEIEICNPAISDGIFLSNAAIIGYTGPQVYSQLEELPVEILERVLLVMNNLYKNPMLHSQKVLSQKESAYGWSTESDGLVWTDYTTLWLAKKQSLVAFTRFYPKDIWPVTISDFLLLHELFDLGIPSDKKLATTYSFELIKQKNFFKKLFTDNLLVKSAVSGGIGALAGQLAKKLLNSIRYIHNTDIFIGNSDFISMVTSKIDPDLLAYSLPIISIIYSLKGDVKKISHSDETKFAELMSLMENSLRMDFGKPSEVERTVSLVRNKLPSLCKKLSLISSDLIAYTILNMINLQMLPGLQIGFISGRLLESQKFYKPLERFYLLNLLHLVRMIPLEGDGRIDPIGTPLPVVTDEYHKTLPLPREVYFPSLSRDAEHLKVYSNKRFNDMRSECWKTLNMNLEIDKAFVALADRLDTSRWFIFHLVTNATVTAFITAVTRDVYESAQLIYNNLIVNAPIEDAADSLNSSTASSSTPAYPDSTHFSDILGVYRTEERMGTEGPLRLPRRERIHDTAAAILESGHDWTRIHHKYLNYPTKTANSMDKSSPDQHANDVFSKLPKLDEKQINLKWKKLAKVYGLRDGVIYPNVLRAFKELILLKEYQLECIDNDITSGNLYDISCIKDDDLRAIIGRYARDNKVLSSSLPPALARHLRLITMALVFGVDEGDGLGWSRCLDYPQFRDDLSEIVDDLFERASVTTYQSSAIDEDVTDDAFNKAARNAVSQGGIYRLLYDPELWTREDYSSYSPKEAAGDGDLSLTSEYLSKMGNITSPPNTDTLLGSQENPDTSTTNKLSKPVENKLFNATVSKLDKLLLDHYPGKPMLVNTLTQVLRCKVLALKKAMKASRDMRDPYLSSQHVNCLLNVRQVMKLLCNHYDLPSRYRIKNALLDNYHPHKPPDFTPSTHADNLAIISEDIDLRDPPPPPTLLELANRKYFREMKKLLTTTIYQHDSKVPYFEEQKQLRRAKEGKKVDENFNYDPDQFFVGRKKHEPVYNVDSDEEGDVDEEIAEKTYPLGFSKGVALDKIQKMPILSPSDEFYLATAYTQLYPLNADKLPLVLKMLGHTGDLIRVEAAKAYLRKSLTTFSDYDLTKFNITCETLVRNQVYEEICLISGGLDLTEHLDNPAGCNDGIYNPWTARMTNRLEHYYAPKEPENLDYLDKVAKYLNISKEDKSMIHDKVFWRVYLKCAQDRKSEVSLRLGLSPAVTDVVDQEIQYKQFRNNYFCPAKQLLGDPEKLVEACNKMLCDMAKQGVIRRDGTPKFSFSGTDNFEFYQAYILALIELNKGYENVEKLGNVLGYFGKNLADQLQKIGTKMYLKYLKDNFSTKLQNDCLKPLEKYNKLFQLSDSDLEHIVKIHRTNLVFDEYSPESGWEDLVRVKEIVEPGCIGEYFGLDNTRSQQWLINILNESINSDRLSDFIRFNSHSGLSADRKSNWHQGNPLEVKIAKALDTLVMDTEYLLDSALEIAIDAGDHIKQCVENGKRMNFVEAAEELSVALKRLSLLDSNQFTNVQKYLKAVPSHRPILEVLQYLKSELDADDLARCKQLITGCVPVTGETPKKPAEN